MNTTKKLMIPLLAMFLMGGITAQAHEATERTIAVEALGVHNVVGVNFDSRFKGNHGFGFRVGVGYAQGKGEHIYISHSGTKTQGFAFPLEINYLLGKKEQKLELGLGTSLGYYGERMGFPVIGVHQYMPVTNRGFGYFVFGNIGYRLQTPGGLMIRTGWAPSINFGDGGTRYLHRRALSSLYIAVGWRL
jgi:hypothetical protein